MATITVWLFIESENLTTDQMSEQIGLACDRSWHKGEARGRTGKVFSTNSWKIEAHSEVDEDPIKVGDSIRACLDSLLGRIRGYADRFRGVAFGRTSGLYIGVSASATPTLEFKADTIKTVSMLGVDLELDLML